MTNTTQAPRPAAVDTEAAWQAVRAMRLAASIAGTDAERADLREWADAHLALAADLDATRAERDAARAALPDADDLDSIAQALPAGPEQLYQWAIADRIRALDTTPVQEVAS